MFKRLPPGIVAPTVKYSVFYYWTVKQLVLAIPPSPGSVIYINCSSIPACLNPNDFRVGLSYSKEMIQLTKLTDWTWKSYLTAFDICTLTWIPQRLPMLVHVPSVNMRTSQLSMRSYHAWLTPGQDLRPSHNQPQALTTYRPTNCTICRHSSILHHHLNKGFLSQCWAQPRGAGPQGGGGHSVKSMTASGLPTSPIWSKLNTYAILQL